MSCVKGQLGLTVRAARARGLSLVQAETNDDGSFCLPVLPDDDWGVSSYYEAAGFSYRLDIALDSSLAAGLCGGSGCKDVGSVVLPALN